VEGGVVDVVVVPDAPDHVAPCAAEDADGVWVGVAAGAGASVLGCVAGQLDVSIRRAALRAQRSARLTFLGLLSFPWVV
jgi:hypothetical protein